MIDVAKLKVLNERTVQDDGALKELAASIALTGLIEPIVARAVNEHYVVIAGRRRVAAIHLAGLPSIPDDWVRIVDVSEEDAKVMEIVENLMREDLHPVDELAAYEDLAKLGMDGPTIARRVGKPIGYIAKRLVLSALEAPMRKAFKEGKLGYEEAYLIARLPGAPERAAAYKQAVDGMKWHQSPTDLARWIHENLTLSLASVPWDLADAGLVKAAGPCTTCPKRTGNQPHLFSKEEQKAGVCLDPACFRKKMTEATKPQIGALAAKGIAVLDQEQAKVRWKKSVKAGTLTGPPAQLDAAAYNGAKSYVERLGALHEENCLAGCPNYAVVVNEMGGLTKACFDTKCLNGLLRKAEATAKTAAAPPKSKAAKKGASKEQLKAAEADRDKTILRKLRPLVDEWHLGAVPPAFATLKLEGPILPMLLTAVARELSRQSYPAVQRGKELCKPPFDPVSDYGGASEVWKRALKLTPKEQAAALAKLLVLVGTQWSPELLRQAATAVKVDALKAMTMSQEMVEVYTSDELEDVATELKLTQAMTGDKKMDKVASLIEHLKPGRLSKLVVKSVEGANP